MKSVKRSSPKIAARMVEYVSSHGRFEDAISYCIQGRSHPVLKSGAADDHVSELCFLVMDDTEDFLFLKDAPREGKAVVDILHRLSVRIHVSEDLEAAKLVYAIAVEASQDLLSIYLRHRCLFDRIAPYRKTLPCLASIHPKSAKVIAQMQRDSHLGTQTNDANHIRSKVYFVSDKPANVYARAIVEYVHHNRDLDPISNQQRRLQKFDREEAVRTVVLPFPKHLKGIETLPTRLAPDNVMSYWRFGKRVIRAEMPEFHLRPEWGAYHKRRYVHGAKKGAVQHAIFKDILIALRGLAGTDSGSIHNTR